jgi:hypothetical protein
MSNKTHRVKPEDRRRINCMRCASPADICEHSEFSASGRAGISFWYYCDTHYWLISENQPCPFVRCAERVNKVRDTDGTPLFVNLDGSRHTCASV